MKKVLAITLMLLLCATVAMAANQSSWRLLLKADNGAGSNAGPGAYVGVYGTSIEGLDFQDGTVSGALGADTPGTTINVLAVVPGMPDLYGKTIKASTDSSLAPKTWDLYVAGNTAAAGDNIRMVGFTVNNALPPDFWAPTCPVGTIHYFLTLVDNKGVVGAPANGTKWEIPVPTLHTAAAFWYSPINLPMNRISVKSNQAMIDGGYKMRFSQEYVPVPEPSGLLALGAGLMGLVGFVTRRRK